MKKNLPYYLVLLFCLISTAAIAQQPVEEWARRYNGMGSQNDFPTSMAVDAAGNAYIAGTTQHHFYSEIAYSLIIVKYAPSGEKLWERTYETNSTAVASAIAVDNTGGVYVAGRIGYWNDLNTHDYLIIRFNAATGEEDWVQTYDSSGRDDARAIAVDNRGGVYVTGSSATMGPTGPIADFATIRYDAMTGAQIWVKHYDGYNGGQDIGTAIVADNSGNIYVTGQSDGGGILPQNATIRYDAATGAEIWVQRGGAYEAIVVDNQGGIYTTGSIRSDSDMINLTVRFDAVSGAITWESLYEGLNNYYADVAAIAVDGQGGVYVTGTIYSSDNNPDYTTIRYSAATGIQSWVQRYDAGSDYATDITTDNSGGVYVTGYSYSDGHYDYATIRYDGLSGTQNWVQRYDGPVHGQDTGLKIATDGLGGLYVTGSSEGVGTRSDMTTIHYTAASGIENWVNRIDVKGNLADLPIAVTVDPEGNSYVTGNSNFYTGSMDNISHMVTIKYSPSGEELWVSLYKAEQNQRASSTAIAVDAEGNTYITGNIYRSHFVETTTQMITIKYSPSGEELWAEIYDAEPNSRAASIAVNNTGGVFVTGYSYDVVFQFGFYNITASKYTTIRYNEATGEEDWISHHTGVVNSFNFASALTVDNIGGVYVTGRSIGNGSSAFSTVRYDAATGAESWAQQYERPDGSLLATAIAVDNNGGVFVTGYSFFSDETSSSSDYTTVGYEAASGTQRWVSHYSGPGNSYDITRAIAADNSGGVYVTGHSYGGSDYASSDFATIRYDAITGDQRWVQRYDGPYHNHDDARAIAVDNQGGVYVTGISYGEDFRNSVFSTIKYTAAEGTQLWEIHSEGPRDGAMDMALDADNNVIVTGYSYNIQTDYDFLTIKYSQSGACAPLAQASIQGSSVAAMDARGVVYSISAPGATTFDWRITDDHGEPYTGFTGQGTGSISVNWPAAPHAFKVSVSYGSGSACPTLSAVTYVHVYEVEAGFVTGGGWLQSPVNTAYEFMRQAGKAHFELMAKYRKGEQNLLQGETQLRLENSGLIFRSTGQEARSLVINENHAFYRGHGTLYHRNDQGQLERDPRRFAFLVAATDGAQGPGKGKGKSTDFLRILVWELNADGTRGAVVYDNQAGFAGANLDENAHPVQPINGGNIVIHSPYLAQSNKHHALAGEGMPGRDGLQAYPTAFSDRTTLAFAAERETAYSLELYDLKGALVKRIAVGTAESGRRYEHEVRAADLGKGMYLARLTTDGAVQTVKIIVNR
jgi:uncharacterized delta-60 repeat protein